MKKKLLLLFYMGSFYFLIGILLQSIAMNLAFANALKGQEIKSVKDVTIEIELNNASVEEIFKKIESVTNYEFVYFKKDLNKSFRLNLHRSKIKVADILLRMSEECDLSFRQENNHISVKRIHSRLKDESKLEIIIQSRSISGQVTSDEGEELPGVNVVEKGTNNGTVTDVQGLYSLEVS